MDARRRVPEAFTDLLTAQGYLQSPELLRAFGVVRRHRFLEGWYKVQAVNSAATYTFIPHDRNSPSDQALHEIYSDQPLVTQLDGVFPTSSTSQPTVVAAMLECLDLRPGHRVLEIGTGTGYNAALLAEIVGSEGQVSSIELQSQVAEKASQYLSEEGYTGLHLITGDGYQGYPEAAPFDRIEATVGCSDLSHHWLEQLTDDGILVLPLRHGFLDPIVRAKRDANNPDCAIGSIVSHAGFMPIQGELSWQDPWSSFLVPPTPMEADWCRDLPDPFAPAQEQPTSAFQGPLHKAFQFFLALNCRELHFNGMGYGLADPGTGARVLLMDSEMRGYSGASTASLEGLKARVSALLERWIALGQPMPEDYTLAFVPLPKLLSHMEYAGTQWMIMRPEFVEIVRLPESK